MMDRLVVVWVMAIGTHHTRPMLTKQAVVDKVWIIFDRWGLVKAAS